MYLPMYMYYFFVFGLCAVWHVMACYDDDGMGRVPEPYIVY